MLRDILLPLISLLSGLVSLFIDPKKDRAKAGIAVAVLVASVIATGIFGYQDEQAQIAAAADAQQQKKELDHLVSVAQSQGTFRLPARWFALESHCVLSASSGKALAPKRT